MSASQLLHLLAALTVILLTAHCGGYLFTVLRQVPVIGEIIGGFILGPTVLGAFDPRFMADIFPKSGPVTAGIALVSQLGQLLLVFLTGAELRIRADARERRATLIISAAGILIPFAAAFSVVRFIDYRQLAGPHATLTTFAPVFAMGIAIAAIPIIARIMMDLQMMDTSFARIVFSVCVSEDVVLYIILGVVLGLAQASSGNETGAAALTAHWAIPLAAVYYIVVALGFFGICLLWGTPFYRWLVSRGLSFLGNYSPTAFRILFMLMVVLCSEGLGINPVFGALLAGICASRGDTTITDAKLRRKAQHAWESVSNISMAFFIPVFFATIGAQLNLLKNLDVGFFLLFLALAYLVKAASVWIGARISGEGARTSLNLAIAMNARGTPGIVLASVSLSAGIINEKFFTVLVLMSILTTQIAGLWLSRAFGRPAVPAAARRPGGDDQDDPATPQLEIR